MNIQIYPNNTNLPFKSNVRIFNRHRILGKVSTNLGSEMEAIAEKQIELARELIKNDGRNHTVEFNFASGCSNSPYKISTKFYTPIGYNNEGYIAELTENIEPELFNLNNGLVKQLLHYYNISLPIINKILKNNIAELEAKQPLNINDKILLETLNKQLNDLNLNNKELVIPPQ